MDSTAKDLQKQDFVSAINTACLRMTLVTVLPSDYAITVTLSNTKES